MAYTYLVLSPLGAKKIPSVSSACVFYPSNCFPFHIDIIHHDISWSFLNFLISP
jgi:hypothetical protein